MRWKFLVLLLTGCGCCSAFKTAVSAYSAHQVEYAQAVAACNPDDAGQYTDECIRNFAFPMSGLRCLVDEDQDVTASRACKCARATDTETRKSACTAWLKEGN
jgi:hypothetical protein